MKKKVKDSSLIVVNVKVPSAVKKTLQLNADKYAEGNLSAWLRHAGMKYTPKKGEHVQVLRPANFY